MTSETKKKMSNGPEDSNAAGWNVELSSETADQAEALLRDLATDAELEMALLVDQSGGMIAGVATRQDVDVSTVGALVAGAFGAMGALTSELGENRFAESLHHGQGDTVYLREVADRFILLGVAPGELPFGIVREKGAQTADKLNALLKGDETSEETEEESAGDEAEDLGPVISAGAVPGAQPEPVEVPAPAAEPQPITDPIPEPELAMDSPADPSPFQTSETGPVTPEPAPAAQPAAHTEISVEDDHQVTMPSLNPELPKPEAEAIAEPEPASEAPPKEESGGNPTYVFEIG